MDPKYKRHSWHQTTSCELIVRSRYLSGPIGSCHDSCKKGHKAESETTTKSHPVQKVMLRSQSERKYLPEVAPSIETSVRKPAFKRLSLPGTELEKLNQYRLPTKEIKRCGSRQRCNEVKEIKKPLVDDEDKPNIPLRAFWKSKPPKRRAMSLNGREIDVQTKVEASSRSAHLKRQTSLAEGRARVGMREKNNEPSFTSPMLPTKQKPLRITKPKPDSPEERVSTHCKPPKETKKTEEDETSKNESPTWRMKFKKATSSILSSGNLSPKKLLFRTPESMSEDKNDVVVDDKKGSNNRARVDREKSHENGAKHQEVVVLRHIETRKDNVIKGTIAIEPPKCKKDMVKVLVGAFEALISLGDRKSLVAASAS